MKVYTERGAAPDYTPAFLASFGVVVFLFLFALFVALGMVPALVAAWLANCGISWRGGQASETT